ncbi:Small secreted domain [Streptomyces sp. TLI_053]|nr:Small secreted domain [Streptomyces sp. TLI_053]
MILSGTTRNRRRPRWQWGAFVGAAVLPLALLTPNGSAAPAPEPVAPSSSEQTAALTATQASDVAAQLRAMGLETVEKDGLIGAKGPAVTVLRAVDMFEGLPGGAFALFTGKHETGTGYLALRGTNLITWAELQTQPGEAVRSVINRTSKPVVVWDRTTKNLVLAEDPGADEDFPEVTDTGSRRIGGAEGVAAGSPGGASGTQFQVPVHLPANLCGNSVDVIALLNPGVPNSCS